MYKTIVLYTEPPAEAKASFEEYYFNNHVPLCLKLPGLVRAEVNRIEPAAPGQTAPFFLITELVFNSKEEANAAWATPEGKAVFKDTRNFPPGIMTAINASVAE